MSDLTSWESAGTLPSLIVTVESVRRLETASGIGKLEQERRPDRMPYRVKSSS